MAAVKDGAEATNAQMEEIKNQLNEKVAELEKKDAEIQQIESSSQGKKLTFEFRYSVINSNSSCL